MTSAANRELIVVTKSELDHTTMAAMAFSPLAAHAGLNEILATFGATISPVFRTLGEESPSLDATANIVHQSRFVRVTAEDSRLESIAALMNDHPEVSSAYIKPPVFAPIAPPPSADSAPASSSFESRQGYLDAAPNGVDARYAWTISGGKGDGIQVFDVEGAWNFSHEDLPATPGLVAGGVPDQASNPLSWVNHGSAVMGEIAGIQNSYGITGISPQVKFNGVSHFPSSSTGSAWGSASAIQAAADRCRPGDIILLEMHRPGPAFNYQLRDDQKGYVAVEWWPDDFQAIRYATAKGVIVVEAAGNGAQNLDDPLYSQRPSISPVVFPVGWTNPFVRANADSGAILVGAGAPPSGHFGAARSRLDFSNYGASLDAQGWGREVVSTGYGDLAGQPNPNALYTSQFSGTSSASPIVTGSLACIQGMLKAAGKTLLTSTTARQLLRSTGSPEPDITQRIGNLPDIRTMATQLSIGAGGGLSQYADYLKQVLYYSRWYPPLQGCLRSQICGGNSSGTCIPQHQQIVNDVAKVLTKCPPSYKSWFCQNL